MVIVIYLVAIAAVPRFGGRYHKSMNCLREVRCTIKEFPPAATLKICIRP